MYGDPEHIDAIAASLDARAEQIDQVAREFVGRTHAVAWASTAADTMRRRARDAAGDLTRVAQEYRDAAEAVREHARAVRRILRWILAIEEAIWRLVDDAWSRITSLGAGIADTAGDVAGAVVDGVSEVASWVGIGDGPQPDPADVRLCQTSWPPPGDRAWLDHADLVRAA